MPLMIALLSVYLGSKAQVFWPQGIGGLRRPNGADAAGIWGSSCCGFRCCDPLVSRCDPGEKSGSCPFPSG
jgi:hypothetical protein